MGDAVKDLIYHIKRRPNLYLMVLPGLVWYIIFCYVPMAGIVAAFQNFQIGKGYLHSDWVGLKYFIKFFNDPYFFRLMRNTFLLGVYSLLWGFPLPIVFALLLNEIKNSFFKRFVQTISYLPYFVSTVILVGILFVLLEMRGIVNNGIVLMGMKPVSFFSDEAWFRTLYVGSGVWQSLGWNAIIYLAALSGINPELYESAIIDGASRWRLVINITVPSIMPTIRILFILTIGGIMLTGFEKVFLLYNPTVYETADVIATYVYRRGIQSIEFSYATAVGLFQSVISFVFLISSNYISKKTSETSLW